MPPAAIVGTSAGSIATDVVSFALPLRASEGDMLVALIATNPGGVTAIASDTGTQDNATISRAVSRTGTAADLWIVMVPFDTDIGPTLSLDLTGTPSWQLSVLLAVRGILDVALVDNSSANVAASTSFACPSLTLTSYSDLYIGAAVVTSAATAVAPPAGCTELHEQQASGRTLQVFSHYRESVGATGTKTSTTAGAQSGLAAAIALRANSTVPAPELAHAAPGAIGFVDVGV